jgi:hypothetical protein
VASCTPEVSIAQVSKSEQDWVQESSRSIFVPFTDFDAGQDIGSGGRCYCVLKDIRPEINWLHSYVTGDKVYCVYLRPTGKPFANTRAPRVPGESRFGSSPLD